MISITPTVDHLEQKFKFADYVQLDNNENRYAENVADLCSRVNFVPKLIVQVGAANSGELEFMHFVEAGAQALLFEPHPDFYQELVDKWAGIKNISIFHLGIHNKIGKFKFYKKWASTCLEECLEVPNKPSSFKAEEIEEIKRENKHFYSNCILFDGIDDGNIDLLYLDCQGVEWFCLERMKSRPEVICVETHYIFTNYTNPYLDKINAWMVLNNYVLVAANESDSVFLLNK